MRGWRSARDSVARLLERLGGRRRRLVVFCCAVVLLGTVAAVFVSRQVAMAGLRREIARLGVQQADAAAQQKELRADLASTTNPKALEDEIRSRLGLVKPGEEKVFFVEEDSP